MSRSSLPSPEQRSEHPEARPDEITPDETPSTIDLRDTAEPSPAIALDSPNESAGAITEWFPVGESPEGPLAAGFPLTVAERADETDGASEAGALPVGGRRREGLPSWMTWMLDLVEPPSPYDPAPAPVLVPRRAPDREIAAGGGSVVEGTPESRATGVPAVPADVPPIAEPPRSDRPATPEPPRSEGPATLAPDQSEGPATSGRVGPLTSTSPDPKGLRAPSSGASEIVHPPPRRMAPGGARPPRITAISKPVAPDRVEARSLPPAQPPPAPLAETPPAVPPPTAPDAGDSPGPATAQREVAGLRHLRGSRSAFRRRAVSDAGRGGETEPPVTGEPVVGEPVVSEPVVGELVEAAAGGRVPFSPPAATGRSPLWSLRANAAQALGLRAPRAWSSPDQRRALVAALIVAALVLATGLTWLGVTLSHRLSRPTLGGGASAVSGTATSGAAIPLSCRVPLRSDNLWVDGAGHAVVSPIDIVLPEGAGRDFAAAYFAPRRIAGWKEYRIAAVVEGGAGPATTSRGLLLLAGSPGALKIGVAQNTLVIFATSGAGGREVKRAPLGSLPVHQLEAVVTRELVSVRADGVTQYIESTRGNASRGFGVFTEKSPADPQVRPVLSLDVGPVGASCR